MTQKTIRLLQLYPRDMNIYGDWGNTLALKRRLEWHGYSVELLEHNPGDTFPNDVDIIVGGGGQDSGQEKIEKDLLKNADTLRQLAKHGIPMLVICGLYQQFGNFFQTRDGKRIQGIGILNIETYGSDERMIGNIVTKSELFGEVIGYENHSGKTYLKDGVIPLGKVIKGAGNSGEDETEGALYESVIGSYMHGSLLPKNPNITDWLIKKAITKKFGSFAPREIDDTYAKKAREIASKRPR